MDMPLAQRSVWSTAFAVNKSGVDNIVITSPPLSKREPEPFGPGSALPLTPVTAYAV